MNARPISVTVIGWLFVCVGCGTFILHTWRFVSEARSETGVTGHYVRDLAFAQISSVLATVGGVGVLRGRSWARLLCVVWLAAHVGLSMMHSLEKTIVHALLLAVISCILFRPRVTEFFRRTGSAESP